MKSYDLAMFGRKKPATSMKSKQRDVEKESAADLSDFAKRAKAERARFAAATDTHFYFSAVFASSADRDTFLAAVGIVPDGRFVNGYTLAEACGYPIKRKAPPMKLRDRRKRNA